MSKNNNTGIWGIISLLVVAALVAAVFFSIPQSQKPSDCTKSQKYDYSTKRCRNKTQKEIAEEKEEERKSNLAIEIRRKKENGELCISSSESWLRAGKGKTYCVAFHPGYFYRTRYGNLFIDEKQDYKNGFVAPLMYRNMIGWDEFLARYRVNMIAVTGELVWYEGHPEIKVYDLSQITIPKLYNCETSEGCVYARK